MRARVDVATDKDAEPIAATRPDMQGCPQIKCLRLNQFAMRLAHGGYVSALLPLGNPAC